MAGFITEAQCAGTCGITTQHAYTYDVTNEKLYGVCRVCGQSHIEKRASLIEYAKAGREPIKGRLNILEQGRLTKL